MLKTFQVKTYIYAKRIVTEVNAIIKRNKNNNWFWMKEIKTSKWKIVITEIGQISMEIEHTEQENRI